MTAKQFPLLAAALMILGGCASTHEAISSKPFQKRKLRSGWHVNLNLGQHQRRDVKLVHDPRPGDGPGLALAPVTPLRSETPPPVVPAPITTVHTVTNVKSARPQLPPSNLTASTAPVPVPAPPAYETTTRILDKVHKSPSLPEGEGSGGTNGLAIAGFITSLFFPIVGLVLSAIALGQIKRTGQRGRGLATAGLVIGIVFTVIALAVIL